MEAADLKLKAEAATQAEMDGKVVCGQWSTLNLEWKEKSTNQDISSIYTI